MRRDVLLGGTGNDVLQGGPGEDWILGGIGNDVLAGGFDRQTADLLWGGDGDDIYQIQPDGLQLTSAGKRSITRDGQKTLIPTYSDRFDGGLGNDQVLFLGGDLDAQGDPISDHVAVKWNTILHRYEWTSRAWDTVSNAFVADSVPVPAVYTAQTPSSTISNGRLRNDAVFTLNINGGASKVITLPSAVTAFNTQFIQLAEQLNAVLAEAKLGGDILVDVTGGRLTFTTIRIGATASISVSAPNVAAGLLGITATANPIVGTNAAEGHAQQVAYYTIVDVESTVVDLQSGNDEFHADPEYLIRGSEWGFGPDARPQRAMVDLVIRGGAGEDRLFGGAGDDSIDGGDGADVIVGGGGNDRILGKPGTIGSPVAQRSTFRIATSLSADLPTIR